MHKRSMLALVVVAAVCAPVLAGGGPQNVLVVYNPVYSWSTSMAMHYQQVRNIPNDNMLALSISPSNLTVCAGASGPVGHILKPSNPPQPGCDDNDMLMMTVPEFTNSIYNPIVNYLAQKGLTNQVYILVLCEGIPWRMWPDVPEDAHLGQAPYIWASPNVFAIDQLGSEENMDTANARFILGNVPLGIFSGYHGRTTYYATNEAFKPGNWTAPTYSASSPNNMANRPIPFLVTMLYGYFAGDYLNGQNLVNVAVDRAVRGDSTFPQSTFLFLNSNDSDRTSRTPYFWIEAETMRQKGFGAICDTLCMATSSLYQPWNNPGFTGSVMGVTMGQQLIPEPGFTGTTASVWSAANGWHWADGAYAETLTSFGGWFLGQYQAVRGNGFNSHTTPEWFMAAGGIGGCGDGKESGGAGSPLPLQFRRYADGFSYVEVMYQSIDTVYSMAVVGDPLSAPFAKRPTVNVTGLTSSLSQGDPLVVSINATPHSRGQAVQRLEAYMDGHYVASYIPSCPAGQTVSVTISGATVSYTTTGGETRGAILGQLQNTINNTLSGSVLTTGADLGRYNFPLTSQLTQVQAQAGTGNPTSGQLMLLSQARGIAGNGIATTTSATAGGGQNFVQPYWLAPATYGGCQWGIPGNVDSPAAQDCLMVAVSQKLVNPGGETLVIEYTSSDLSFTASGVVTLTDTMNEKDIAWAILSEMAELSQDAYWCWWSSGHGFLNSNGRLGPGQIS